MKTEFYDFDGHCIPLDFLEELYLHLEYGSVLSCWIKVMQQTGCRMKETDWMKHSFIKDGIIFWKLGKNQSGYYRKEQLSADLLKEIDFMRAHHRIMHDDLFPCKTITLRRYFNKFIMPNLSPRWHEKRVILSKKGFSYERKYQLKGLRKNFQTFLFYYYWQKYNSADLALEMVSKRMKHSSRSMTCKHYVESCEQFGMSTLDMLIGRMPFEWIHNSGQHRIYEYFMEDGCPA